MPTTELALTHPRRSYPKELKAQIVAQCRQPGVSVAGVALSHGINANLVRKWIRQAERQPAPAFVPIMPAGVPGPGRHIEIHLARCLSTMMSGYLRGLPQLLEAHRVFL